MTLRAGKPLFPALLLSVLTVTGLLPAGRALPVPGGASPAAAAPAGDPLPDHRKLRAGEAGASPLEKAVRKVAADLRSGRSVVPTPEAVRYALYLHARDGRGEDLVRAGELAGALRGRDPDGPWITASFEVARAEGNSRGPEEDFRERRQAIRDAGALSTAGYARFVELHFARAAALGEEGPVRDALLAAASCLEERTRSDGLRLRVLDGTGEVSGSLLDHVEMLAVADLAAGLSGSTVMRDDAVRLARELDRRFWDDDAEAYRVPELDPAAVGEALRRNANAARLLWSVGYAAGDTFLQGRAARVLESGLAPAIADPLSAPAAALAAARVGGHPVQMVLIGEAGDPKLARMRRASFFFFEPRRVILNLDPVADAGRIEELLYPADLAPVLFVCVESICSAPITSAERIESQVKLILAQSAAVQ